MSVDRIEDALREWLKGAERVVVVGVGNELRRDDFVGILVVRGLKEKVSKESVTLVESETAPESFIEPIVESRPSHVLVIDAGLLGVEAGGVWFEKWDKVLGEATSVVSTHALPLRIFCEYLVKVAGCRVGLLVVQPERTDFGVGLSVEVRRVTERLVGVLSVVLSEVDKY